MLAWGAFYLVCISKHRNLIGTNRQDLRYPLDGFKHKMPFFAQKYAYKTGILGKFVYSDFKKIQTDTDTEWNKTVTEYK